MSRHHTEGDWNPAEPVVYFLACSSSDINGLTVSDYPYRLIAVNEIKTNSDLEAVTEAIHTGGKIFIDSGVFWLTNQHKRRHGMSMDDALALPPEEIDGFDKLFDSYCDIMTQFGDSCWGYIEIDQGGRDNKIKTRQRLHELGYDPIPVYHPLNDGWDYFDYLADNYDRICFGNIVQAEPATKRAIIATAWERKAKRNPELWIHLLGYTPQQWSHAYPLNSCDSSSWKAGLRFQQGELARAALKTYGRLPHNFRYRYKDRESHEKATALGAYHSWLNLVGWRNADEATH